MKIGIFGGSFNPVHNMHKNIALELINRGYLDKVIYVPTGDKYNKKDLINFKDRLDMLKLMIDGNDDLKVSDIGSNELYQYTYQVLDYFRSIYGSDDIYFICGSDNLKFFDTWMKYQYVLEYYKLLVIKRNGDNIDDILNKYRDYIENIIIADIQESGISSTYIRDNILDDDVSKYLDSKVYTYIKRNKIYGRR